MKLTARNATKSAKAAAVALLVLATGAVAYKVYRAVTLERATFKPPRGEPPRPVDFGAARDIVLNAPGAPGVRGWYLPSKNGAAIVYAHGSPSMRAELVPEARRLATRGYGALLFDFPGHGASDGGVTWGASDRAALGAAVAFLAEQPEVDPSRIGALGFSMGSCIVAQVAATEPRIAAVILEGAFTNVIDQLRYEYGSWGPITQLPALWTSRRGGMLLEEMRPIDDVGRIAPRPLLLISGTADKTVPPSMARELFDAAGEPKELWLVPGAAHGHYAEAAGEAYLNRVDAFFTKALAPKR